MNHAQPTYLTGLKHGVPTAMGYFIVSFTFGMMAGLGGMSTFYATLISMTSLTSAGQFAGLNILFQNGSYLELMIAMVVINSRYSLMGTAMSQKLEEKTAMWQKMLMSIFITDENFAVAMVEVETITFQYYLGVATLPYLGWSMGTLLGSMVDNLLPQPLQNAASIALYGMFIALFIPPAKEQKPIRQVVAVTLGVGLLLYYMPIFDPLSTGYKIMVAAIIGSIFGAFIHPQEVV